MNQHVLKGLLIILVILDHNEYARDLFPQFLNGFSFHVIGFFALPFLRPLQSFGKNTLEKLSFAYFYPYVWFVCGMALITSIVSGKSLIASIPNLLLAIYSGNAFVLKDVTRMSLLWFLPSFVSLLLIRNLVFESQKNVKTFLILLFLLMHVGIGYIGGRNSYYVPMGLLSAAYAFPLITIIIYLHKELLAKLKREQAILISSVALILSKYWQIHMGLHQELAFVVVSDFRDMAAIMANDLEAITGTLFLFQISRLNMGRLIEIIGRNSMQVYLFHAFVALLIFKLIEVTPNTTPVEIKFLLSMVLTTAVTSFIAQIVMKNSVSSKLLFPRNWKDFSVLVK